jgi:hypothetical protein
MRLKGRVDRNQHDIVIALRDIGADVAVTSSLGNGFADLLVQYNEIGYGKKLILMEVKSKGGRLTEDERYFYDRFRECMVVVFSVDDALKSIGAI